MIIALSGKAQSGKDTVCKMIQYCIYFYTWRQNLSNFPRLQTLADFGIEDFENISEALNLDLDSSFLRKPFAGSLKEASAAILGVPVEAFEDIDFKNSKIDWLCCKDENVGIITVRQFLQKFGTAAREVFGESFWAQSLLRNYEDTDNWIITDLRYISELNCVKYRDPDAVLIRIDRPGIPLMNHSSEIDLDRFLGWNHFIYNDGTKEELLYMVRDVCREIFKGKIEIPE